MEYIRIRGARTHNLKNINLELPRHRLIVVTGLSGSGKSSLAFDTLYAEGQRRYVESLSAYARQFLQLMEKPDVDLIEGLSPAISIEQKATSHNPRSTVGTVTEIHDYLRLLYARVGDPYCPDHPEQKLAAMTISQMVDATLALPEDTKLMILAPVVVNRKGEQLELLVELRAKGFVRVRVDGKVLRDRRGAEARQEHQAHGRGRRRPAASCAPDLKQRLAESFETALRAGDGRAIVVEMDKSRGRGASLLGEVRLPDLQLLAVRARAAAVLVQQPDGRVPALRRPGLDQLLRSEARRRLSAALARVRRDQGLGPAQPVLLPDAREPREARGLRPRAPVRAAARARPAARPLRQRRRDDPVHVPVRARPADGARARVRGDHPEPRASLPRDRLGDGPRGAREVPELEAVPRMRRHAPAARGALRQGRQRRERARDLRGVGLALKDAAEYFGALVARRPEARDRREDHQGDRQPPRVPEQRRPRLPVARPLGRDAVGRRVAADPARLADRLGPDRRDVRAGRAVDRPAPARQRPAARHAQAPARPRQQRDRRRARPRRDLRRRLHRRHGAGRRRARRAGRRAGNARGDPARDAVADRPVPRRPSADPDAGAPAARRSRARC